jgi:predicted phage terminase large subunit-like protein
MILSDLEGYDELFCDPVSQLADLLVEQICRYSPEARTYRRGATGLDLLGWGRRFLPAYFRQAPSKMHFWLSGELERATVERGAKINVLGPRGSAKSTIGALCYVLKSAIESTEPYIWIISATKEQAKTHLEHVKAEVEENASLARAYPRSAGRGKIWRTGALELRNGAVVEAYSAGQQLRGRRRREHRPSLIVCDDIENDFLAASPEQRASCREWIQGSVLKAGDNRTNVVNLATALHRESLAMHLHQSPGWTSRLFRSIERWPENMDLWRQWEELYCDRTNPRAAAEALAFFEQHQTPMLAGAELLWPAKEDLYSLMRMRADGGRTAFEREKQNSPIDPERCEWPPEYFDHHIWFREWPTEVAVKTMALDPSKGVGSKHGDYSAFVLLAIDVHGVLYVEADLARRPTPEMVYDGAALYLRFNPDAFCVEANQFQDLLCGEFAAEFRRRKSRVVRPLPLPNYTNKFVRIRKLGPYLAQRRLRFLSNSSSTQKLVDQLRDFPLGDHDDGPDALEMALRLAESIRGEGPVDDGLGDRLISEQ